MLTLATFSLALPRIEEWRQVHDRKRREERAALPKRRTNSNDHVRSSRFARLCDRGSPDRCRFARHRRGFDSLAPASSSCCL